jgi:hypothetical protein
MTAPPPKAQFEMLNGIMIWEDREFSATANSGGLLRVFHESSEHVRLALTNHSLLKAYHRAGVLSKAPLSEGNLYFFNQRRMGDYDDREFKAPFLASPKVRRARPSDSEAWRGFKFGVLSDLYHLDFGHSRRRHCGSKAFQEGPGCIDFFACVCGSWSDLCLQTRR